MAPEDRAAILADVLPATSADGRPGDARWRSTPARWEAVRAEAARVLDTVERSELRDTELAARSATRSQGRIAGDLTATEAALAAALIRPAARRQLLVLPELTEQARSRAAEGVEQVEKSWEKGETIVRSGDRVDEVAFEAIDRTSGSTRAAWTSLGWSGFVVLSLLVIGLLLDLDLAVPARVLASQQRLLLLLSLLLLVAVFALKLSAGRAWLPYALPLAAIGMLVTVLLDAGDRDGPHRADR